MMTEPNQRNVCGGTAGCTNDAVEPHTCPYQEEINDDYESLCQCCDDCRLECVWAI